MIEVRHEGTTVSYEYVFWSVTIIDTVLGGLLNYLKLFHKGDKIKGLVVSKDSFLYLELVCQLMAKDK